MEVWQQDWMAKWAVYSPHKIALKEYETGSALSYLQLNSLGNKLSFYLTEQLNMVKGDRIAFVAENCLEYLLFFVAAQKTGIILVPLNYRLTTSELNHLIEISDPKFLIHDNVYKDKVSQTAFSKNKLGKVFEITDFSEILNNLEGKKYKTDFPINIVDENHPIFILFTSGTTGIPKGAIYTHKMLFWNSINTAISLVINTDTKTINCMPPFHTGGWNVLVTPVLHHGGSLVIIKSFCAKTILNLIEEEQFTLFMGVPTMLKMMSEEPSFKTTDFSSLMYFIVGGEAMPIPLIEAWKKQGVLIRQGYGLTEVGPNLTSLHQDDAIRKKGSIGRPNFYVQTKIVDENGIEVGKNQKGELLLKGPMVSPGYWKNKQATEESLKDGWFYTGDVVISDEEDYLFVVDRIKNMYISGAENVYPAEIERVLLEHSAVLEVAVISVPHEKWGEVGKAFIVTAEKSLTEKEILDYCQMKLAKYKIPKYIEFLKEIPKNDTGKIDRKLLKNKR